MLLRILDACLYVYMWLYLFISAVLSFNHNSSGFSVCSITFYVFISKMNTIKAGRTKRMFTYHGSKSRQFIQIKWKCDDVLYDTCFEVYLWTIVYLDCYELFTKSIKQELLQVKFFSFNKEYDLFLIFSSYTESNNGMHQWKYLRFKYNTKIEWMKKDVYSYLWQIPSNLSY